VARVLGSWSSHRNHEEMHLHIASSNRQNSLGKASKTSGPLRVEFCHSTLQVVLDVSFDIRMLSMEQMSVCTFY
jgi:hypothetical protein